MEYTSFQNYPWLGFPTMDLRSWSSILFTVVNTHPCRRSDEKHTPDEGKWAPNNFLKQKEGPNFYFCLSVPEK